MSTKINILKPCSEQWSAMDAVAQGRHCASCEKVVHDLTGMSDAELIAFIGSQGEKTCGRFRKDQVGITLMANSRNAISARHWLSAVLASALTILSSQSVKAQTHPPTPSAYVSGLEDDAAIDSVQHKAINGRLVDAESGEPIPFANIAAMDKDQHTLCGTSSDVEGYFRLMIPVELLLEVKEVKAYCIGYSPISVCPRMEVLMHRDELDLRLSPMQIQTVLMGMYVEVLSPPRQFARRVKNIILRPFRR